MKNLSLFAAIIALALLFQVSVVSAQRRPVRKPATTTAPTQPVAKTTPKVASPADEFFNQGLKCDAKDYDCQVSNYTKAINLGLNTKEVYKNRGNAYLAKEEYAKAIADLTRVIELDLNDANGFKNRGKAIYNLAQSDKELDKAIADFSSAIELEPKDAQAYKYRGLAYFTRSNFEKANVDFEKALALNPKDTDIYFNQGEAFLESRDYGRAVELFTKAISLSPSDTDLYSKRALIFFRQKKYDLALSDFAKIAELDPKKDGVNGMRGEIFLENKNYEEAINAFTKEIGLQNKQQNYYYYQRGKTYRSLKKDDEALSDFTRIIELSPQFAAAYEERASIFHEKKNYDRAIEDATKAINFNPKSKKAYEIRALSLYGKNGTTDQQAPEDYKKHFAILIETSNRIIQSDPQNISAYLDRAKANFYTQRYELALADFTKVIELDPKNYTAFYHRGMLRTTMYYTSPGFKANPLGAEPVGDVQQSIQDFSRAIEIEPNKDEAYSLRAARYYYLAYVNKVDILGNRENAINDYVKVIKLNPRNVAAYNEMARFAVELKKFDGAVTILSDAVTANPENPNAYFNRALFFQYTTKDKNRAAADYEKCIQFSTDGSLSHLKKICSDNLMNSRK